MTMLFLLYIGLCVCVNVGAAALELILEGFFHFTEAQSEKWTDRLVYVGFVYLLFHYLTEH